MVEFFDKLKKGLDKGVTAVTVKSKEMLEATQLRSQVKTLQEERLRELEELGSIVYTLHVQGKLSEGMERVQTKCEKVASLDQKLREKAEEIYWVHIKAQEALGAPALPVAVCACGAPVHEGTKFCGGCGKPVEKSGSRPEGGKGTGGGRCPKCAMALAAGTRFCANCGATIETETP
jgi:hypothetical protein